MSGREESGTPGDAAAAVSTPDGERVATAFAEYHQALQSYLARRLGRTEEVRDLVQEVFLRFLRIEQSRVVENPQAFLYGIASNVVLERRRARQRQAVIFNSRVVDHDAENPREFRRDELGESLALERQLEAAARQLTPIQLRILQYWRGDGLSFEEIATVLGLSPHTVKKYATQAIASIRMSCV